MRYPGLGEKTDISGLLGPGFSNRGEPRCFIRQGTDPNEATLSLAIDIDRAQITSDHIIIPAASMRDAHPGLLPSTTADAPVAVESGELTFLRFEPSGNIRIMNGWAGFSSTSWSWLIGQVRYEKAGT